MGMTKLIEDFGAIFHGLSLVSIVSAVFGILPGVATIIAITWYSILIWESKTFRSWRARFAQRRLARLEAKKVKLLAVMAKSSEEPELTDD